MSAKTAAEHLDWIKGSCGLTPGVLESITALRASIAEMEQPSWPAPVVEGSYSPDPDLGGGEQEPQ